MESRAKFTTVVLTALILVAFMVTLASAAGSPKWIGAFLVKGKVGLKWKAVDGIAEYTVFRKVDEGDFKPLATLADVLYFDTDLLPGSVFIYKITYTDSDGAEMSSDEKTVAIPGAKAGEFVPPQWSGVRKDHNNIMLRWDNVKGAIAYNIYRSTTSGGEYEVVGNATTYRYIDKDDFVKGQTYYYVLTALNEEFDETEFSEERSIKFGRSAEEVKALQAAESEIVLVDLPMTLLFDLKLAGSKDMNQPADVALNSKGNIYITDALNFRVVCFDATGEFLFSFGELTASEDLENPPEGTFSYPFTLFIDKSDQVYVTDVKNNDIQVFTPDGKFIKRILVDCGEGKEKFRPNGIHVLDDGRIVCTDAGNHRFMIIDQNGKILLSKGEKGSENGQFVFPDEILVTPDNKICVVDVINCRVQIFDMEGKFILAFGEAGQSAGTFGRPKSIALDDKNQLWIADAMGNLVQVFNMQGEIKSVVGMFDDESLRFMTPRGMVIKDGKFYIVNRLHNRLMVFKLG